MGLPESSIVVVGSLNLDLLLHVPHLPAAGETLAATQFTRLPGGKGANQAVAAARLGTPTAMLGAVGNDDAAHILLEALAAAGVDTSPIVHCENSTGTATILLTPAGENSIVIAPGANASLSPAHVKQHRARIAQAGLVLAQLETPITVLEELLTIPGASVMLDPAPAAPLPARVLQNLAWFTPNETEAAFFLALSAPQIDTATDTDTLRALCLRFQSMGPRNILLKLGSRGACVLTQSGEFHHAPAPRVAVVDTTGAGDTLNAAFATALLHGDSPSKALHYAVAAASLSVTRMGAMASSPTASELTNFIS